MRRTGLAALCVLALVGSGSVALADSDCKFTDARSGSLDASGLRLVRVVALGGSLNITGEAGSSELRAAGEACASSRSLLDDIELRVDRRGDVAEVEVKIPQKLFGNYTARLDLEVRVPAHVDLEVDDGSGSLEIAGVGSVVLEDGSGNIRIEDVSGDVEIDDGSGSMVVARIDGNLRVTDGSGEIEVRGVGGDVIITEDGSGGMEIAGVEGSVRVLDDGSGSIRVTDVNGDFVVEDDGSGGVSYERIGGRVAVDDD